MELSTCSLSYTGGITTLIDMPLNSFPSTVSEETFKLKVWMAYLQLIHSWPYRLVKCVSAFLIRSDYPWSYSKLSVSPSS